MRKRNFFYLLGLFCLFSLVPLFFKLVSLFEIRKVYIIGNFTEISSLYELNGKNLLFLDGQKLAKVLVENNFLYKSISVIKNFPDSLTLIPVERVAKAKIKYGGKILFIDEDFFILPKRETGSDLPTIMVQNIPLEIRHKADWRVGRALTLFDQSFKQGVILPQILIDGNLTNFKAFLHEGTEIIIPMEADVFRTAASLQIIISRFRIEGKFVRSIDLQFDKPVVILESGEKISSSIEL